MLCNASANLHYTTDTLSGFVALAMEQIPGTDTWSASIPPVGEDAVVHYYIEAVSQNGKAGSRPLTAPAGYWSFLMEGTGTSSVEPTDGQASVAISNIFPNPARAITCIPLQVGSYKGEVQVDLVDAWGNRFPIWEGEPGVQEQNVFLNASLFPSGTYAVRVITPQGIASRVLVIAE